VKKLKSILMSTRVSAGLLSSAAVVAADIEDTIKARQSLMQLYAFNLGLVGDMAKGKSEYDAEIAANVAQNLLVLAKLKTDPMWPPI
jgi:cytochrome c556